MPQKLSVDNFEWIKETSRFNEDFVKKLYWRKWWRIFPWSWCSISWKITRTSGWFTIFTTKNENGKSRLVANLHDKNWICFTYKKFKTSVKK